MKKLCSNRGETLVETLAALLVATLVLMFLATAIAAAFKVSAAVKKTDTAFRYEESAAGAPLEVQVQDSPNGFSSESITVTEYQAENGYRYYQK